MLYLQVIVSQAVVSLMFCHTAKHLRFLQTHPELFHITDIPGDCFCSTGLSMKWIESISDQPLIKLVLMLVVCKWRKQLSLPQAPSLWFEISRIHQNSRIESLPATLEFSLAKWLLWSLRFRFVVPTELLPPLLWKTVAAGVQHWKEPGSGSGWEDVGRGRGWQEAMDGYGMGTFSRRQFFILSTKMSNFTTSMLGEWKLLGLLGCSSAQTSALVPGIDDAAKWRELGGYSCSKSSSRPTSGCVWNGGYPPNASLTGNWWLSNGFQDTVD